MSDEHQCDRYGIPEFPGVEFCRKSGAQTVHLRVADLKRQLAESQAREQALRAAVAAIIPFVVSVPERRGLEAALAAPTDGSALREFGLKVAQSTWSAAHSTFPGDSLETIVDAVLRGGEK